MMGRLKSDQGQLFSEFHLGDAVPEDHLVRKIDAALDLSVVTCRSNIDGVEVVPAICRNTRRN
jgi:hypothetical protein